MRQHEVEYHQVWTALVRQPQRVPAVVRHANGVATAFQVHADQIDGLAIVVDDQNLELAQRQAQGAFKAGCSMRMLKSPWPPMAPACSTWSISASRWLLMPSAASLGRLPSATALSRS